MNYRVTSRLLMAGIVFALLSSADAFSQQQAGPAATGATANPLQTQQAAQATQQPSATNIPKDPNAYEERFDYGQLDKIPQTADKKSFEDTLYRVSLNTMEEGGDWIVTMPFDYGRAVISMRDGTPDGVKNAPAAVNQLSGNPGNANAAAASGPNSAGYFSSKPDTKSKVLGIKVNFYPGRRTSPWLRVDAVQPIPLDGIVKGFEFWVSGREVKNDLYIIVEDAKGQEQLIFMGTLNFLGWRKLTAQVPAYIDQQDPHNLDHRGLVFKGFYIKFRMLDAMGTYFVYFDNLSAEVSRYVEENQLKDDVRDNW